MARNITEVRLLNVPLENDYLHTLYFGSKTAQESYFKGCTIPNGSDVDFSYQRKDDFIAWGCDYDSIIGSNYVMYRNTAYTDKWYYAFITQMKFVNDGRTDIYIETDVFQTWLFDYTVKHSFVEREHVNDDTIGLHTVDECLELGEFVVNDHDVIGTTSVENLYYVLGTTADPNTGEDVEGGGQYNSIYSGVKYYRYNTVASVNAALKKLAEEGKVDAITGLFMVPPTLCYGAGEDNAIPYSKEADIVHYTIEKTYNLNGYTPKNNKLKCFPFNYLGVSNNNGASALYKYEYFSEPLCGFTLYGALCPGASYKLIPKLYKGSELNHDEGLVGGKFPICNFAVDMYTNWLTQNSVNNAVSILAGLGNIGIGAAGIAAAGVTGGLSLVAASGAVAGGIAQVADTVGRINQASFMPDQARGNTNCGDVTTSMSANNFQIYHMSIKREYAEIIDKFLSMFGYKVTISKIPNKNHRENYWYTKLIDANITGPIPINDIQKIKAAYNRGITFWRNADNIKNYSVSNGII